MDRNLPFLYLDYYLWATMLYTKEPLGVAYICCMMLKTLARFVTH